MTFAMSDVKKKILERSGFRVHVRKVMNDVKELINNGDVESVRLKLKSQKINLEKEYRSTRLRANSPMPTRLRLLVNSPT